MCAALRGRTAEAYLLDDFQARFTDGALAPEDVPRNRIYSIAAALGVLLDAFHIPWQLDAARGDSAFSLTNALRKSLASDEEDIAQRFKQAREEYGFDGIKATSQRLMADYSRAYDRAIAAFNAQPGVRIDVELRAAGLSRSRFSRGRRWVVDQGQTVFASEYAAYTLRRAGHDTISVTVTNKGLLDSSSGATRRIVFFVPVVTGINVDGANVDRADGEFHFRSLSLTAPNASITLRANGTIRRNGDVIRITALD
jgi:hypothetical protein